MYWALKPYVSILSIISCVFTPLAPLPNILTGRWTGLPTSTFLESEYSAKVLKWRIWKFHGVRRCCHQGCGYPAAGLLLNKGAKTSWVHAKQNSPFQKVTPALLLAFSTYLRAWSRKVLLGWKSHSNRHNWFWDWLINYTSFFLKESQWLRVVWLQILRTLTRQAKSAHCTHLMTPMCEEGLLIIEDFINPLGNHHVVMRRCFSVIVWIAVRVEPLKTGSKPLGCEWKLDLVLLSMNRSRCPKESPRRGVKNI